MYSLVAMIMATTLLSIGPLAVGAWVGVSLGWVISGADCFDLSSSSVAPHGGPVLCLLKWGILFFPQPLTQLAFAPTLETHSAHNGFSFFPLV